MKQKYYPYKEWEDFKAGMWRKVPAKEEKEYLEKAIVFTGDAIGYGRWMEKVIELWPIACEHNLTDMQQNRRAWIGHAACCLSFGCPEYITRMAWGFLTQKQQDDANAMADKAIARWEEHNIIHEGEYAQNLFEY